MCISGLLLAEWLEQPGCEAADDQQLVVLDQSSLVFGRLGDDACVEVEQGGRGTDIALQGFGHQRFDQGALLADAPWAPALAHRDLLAEFGGEIGRQICAALRATLGIARFAGLEPGRLGRFAVPDVRRFGHRLVGVLPPAALPRRLTRMVLVHSPLASGFGAGEAASGMPGAGASDLRPAAERGLDTDRG